MVRAVSFHMFLRPCQIVGAGPPGIGRHAALVDGDEMALLHHDPAVHHGPVHRAPGGPPWPARRRGCTRRPPAPAGGNPPGRSPPVFQRPAVRCPPGPAAGRCPGWQSSAPGSRRGPFRWRSAGGADSTPAAPPSGTSRRCWRAVHRQAHGDAQLQHLRHPATPEASFMLEYGAVGHAGAGAGELVQLLRVEVDAGADHTSGPVQPREAIYSRDGHRSAPGVCTAPRPSSRTGGCGAGRHTAGPGWRFAAGVHR